MIDFEFTVTGPPISHQTRNRQRLAAWKQIVRSAAAGSSGCPVVPIADEVSVEITYFYEGDSPDVDNIIKPIQDAMVGLVYIDDAQVVSAKSWRRGIGGSYVVRHASSKILLAFANGNPFIHVRVKDAEMSNTLT